MSLTYQYQEYVENSWMKKFLEEVLENRRRSRVLVDDSNTHLGLEACSCPKGV
jgi:hypothetical protein